MSTEHVVPAGWQRLRIGDIADVRLGRQRSPSNRPGKFARPYLRAANVTWQGLDLSDVMQMDFRPGEFENYVLKPGDILLAEASGSPGEVGKPALWRGEIDGCCFQNTLIRVRSRGALPEFLRYRFLHDALSGRFATASKGVGIHHLGAQRFSELQIDIPRAEQQARLVAEIEKQFTRLDAGVTALKRLQVHLKRYRAAVLVAATEGRLVPSEADLARQEGRECEYGADYLHRLLRTRREVLGGRKYREPAQPAADELPKLPEGWTWTTVESVGDVLLGRRRAPEYLASPHPRPYLRVANVKDDHLDLSDVRVMNWDDGDVDKYALLPADILVSEGQSPELVGQSAVYKGGIDGLCFQATLHRFRPLPGGPSPGFAQLVFRAHVRTGVFRAKASITTNIAHLTLEKFKAAPFPLPPEAEQERIVAEAERLLSSADAVEALVAAQLRRATALRRAILAAAFEGRLLVQDPEEALATVPAAAPELPAAKSAPRRKRASA